MMTTELAPTCCVVWRAWALDLLHDYATPFMGGDGGGPTDDEIRAQVREAMRRLRMRDLGRQEP